jgi:hypothetical protein
MIKIIKERTPVTITEYYIEYSYKDDPDSGFRFPATKSGAPDFDRMPPEARANYEACLTDERLLEPEFTIDKHTYTEPAVGLCTCGREVELVSDYMGATSCDCGRWYNVFGQELRDPKYWEEEY